MSNPEGKIIGPSKGVGERNLYCVRYGACLDRAIAAGWMDFNCDDCSIKITSNASEVTSDIPPITSGLTKEEDMAEESVRKEGEKVCAQCGKSKPLKRFRYYKKSQEYSANCMACIGVNIKAGQEKRKDKRLKDEVPAPAGSNGKLKIVVEVDIDTIVDEVTRRLSQKLTG